MTRLRFVRAAFLALPVLLALAVSLSGRPVAYSQEATGAISWRTDYEPARREAKQSGKPLFVVFRCER